MQLTPLNDFSGQWIGHSTIEITKDNPMEMSTTTPSKVGTVSEQEAYLTLNKSFDGTIYNGSIFCKGEHEITLSFPNFELGTDDTNGALLGSNKFFDGFPFTTTVISNITGSVLSPDSILLEWNTAFAKHKTTLFASHKINSPTVPTKELTWDDFKRMISTLPPSEYIFRGQRNSQWRLRTSFFRSGGNDLGNYFNTSIPDLMRSINSISSYIFSNNEISAILNLAQHHGFPTPLIDWTESPYVAAYFAFRGTSNETQQEKSKIYILDRKKWDSVKPEINLDQHTRESFRYLQRDLYIDFVDLPILNNNRAMPQQALVGITNIDDIEAYYSKKYNEDEILYAVTIAHTERSHILQDLNYMGINAATLFPGLDGLCEKFKEKYF